MKIREGMNVQIKIIAVTEGRPLKLFVYVNRISKWIPGKYTRVG